MGGQKKEIIEHEKNIIEKEKEKISLVCKELLATYNRSEQQSLSGTRKENLRKQKLRLSFSSSLESQVPTGDLKQRFYLFKVVRVVFVATLTLFIVRFVSCYLNFYNI